MEEKHKRNRQLNKIKRYGRSHFLSVSQRLINVFSQDKRNIKVNVIE